VGAVRNAIEAFHGKPRSGVQCIENKILPESGRHCSLCFGLRGDLSYKGAQIAHIDRDAKVVLPTQLPDVLEGSPAPQAKRPTFESNFRGSFDLVIVSAFYSSLAQQRTGRG
jgi:hypothetical protein